MRDLHQRLREFWDRDAETYDHSPSHSVSDPVEAAAWRALLRRHLPPPPASILDVGAGTGAITILVAELGHRVTALDLSPGMLRRAQDKAERRGLDVEVVVAPATEPPPGPFDAVVERHLLWTTPDPVAALTAWRRVAPSGVLVLFEGIWDRRGMSHRLRSAVSDVARRALAVQHDHHGVYDPEVLAKLPLVGAPSPTPWIEAVEEAGWRSVRLERLHDVEWSRRVATPWPLGWLEGRPQFAVVAEA